MKIFKRRCFIGLYLVVQMMFSQEIPFDKVIPNGNLVNYLKANVKVELGAKSFISESDLALYFREKFSERYYYDWKTVDARFEDYNSIYPKIEKKHEIDALDHISKYADSTVWKLPFNYPNGNPVNAYALRHLARQHKMVDIAFYYNYQNKDSKYIDYFTNQLNSLNVALEVEAFETIDDGNGVYEAFRSGYRVLNWLQIHNLFLGEEAYSDSDQLATIATLLQHGAHLYERNAKFHAGNHQTRGLSALAMISILLRDFKGTEVWYEHAMHLLEEHLSKEINDDGFQFERTVHYHMSDIGNYYYVYQLAKLSGLEVNDFWKNKLKSLFVTLTKIAYPDKTAPVLSDDTGNPWGEKNDISGALTLGYLLFDSPKIGYFAHNHVDAKMYWYLSEKQLKMLEDVDDSFPTMKSVDFPTTGYYVMRAGWHDEDKMMIISAGLDADKPDHQHGDMLGVQAMANGKVVLPNYQVRYSLNDLELFKNSMTKNVALVDDELQGEQYTSNKGGSGFGKFLELPKPETITWKSDGDLDVFIGSHDGFENVGVKYTRQVIYVKDDFWIVKDNFKSDKSHTYKQVWQGHYSLEQSPNLIRTTFDDATGFDIYQLNETDSVSNSGQRGKGWSVVSKKNKTEFSFITVLFPYKGYSNRIDEDKECPDLKDWTLNNSKWEIDGKQPVSLSKDAETIFFSIKRIKLDELSIEFSELSDVFVILKDDTLTMQSLCAIDIHVSIKGIVHNTKIRPGTSVEFSLKN